MTAGSLLFKAGPEAYRSIRNDGFSEDRIGTLVGASGGAKWLVLSQLDRVVLARILPRIQHPVDTLGSSIGSWRFACYGQSDPVAAIERLEHAYIEQSYSDNPDTQEITEKSREILGGVLGDTGIDEILGHPWLRTSIMTVRARHVTASDKRPLLGFGLLLAMSANAVHRKALGAFFSRGLFYDPRSRPPFYDVTGFPIDRVPLTADNFADAVLASGSIPMILHGVRDIAGAPRGTYRDGGVIDYHLDVPTAGEDALAFFPHFFDWFKPGWFDRQLRWRGVNPDNFARTLVICPSPEFIARLPGAKVPDRTDFVRLTPGERMRVWRQVVAQCRELADELNDAIDTDRIPALVQPL